ncbi:MAG: oligopeptide/dipeptide ABC transporter ATP-binding protein [Bacillota bacterium]
MVSKGEIPSPVNVPPGCSFHSRCPYVMDVCRSTDPKMISLGGRHTVRCHLYSEGEQSIVASLTGTARS